MTVPILNFVEFGQKESTPIIILHGFLGSCKNWMTIGKALSENYRVITVDLRNHGDSFHHLEHSYEVMVEDIVNLLDHLELDKVLLMGHSMGGKVAMKFACNHPERLWQLIVVDIAPKQYFPDRRDIKLMLDIDLSKLENKQSAEDQLAKEIKDLGLRKFLLTNLSQNKDGQFYWRANLKVFLSEIPSLGNNPILETEKFIGNSLFIIGGKSNFVKEPDYPVIYKHFPNAEIEVIESSDHNPHFSTRDKFLELLAKHLIQN